MLNCDEYLMPESLDEAFDLIERHAGRYRIVAGATDLLPWAREGRAGDVHYPVLIDISRVPELDGVERRGDRLRLGANTTFADFLNDAELREALPIMPHVAVWFADDQIRELATLAGNLINASPAADGTPPMIALNGTVTLECRRDGARRRRELDLTGFVTGPAPTRIKPGEILTAIECDALAGYGSAFEKVGHRRSLVISTVCVAALVKLDEAGAVFEDVRLALAAVGPVPVRLTECEEFLVGRPATADVIEEASRLPIERVQSRTRQDYRREVVENFVARALTDALAELGVSPAAEEPVTKEVSYG